MILCMYKTQLYQVISAHKNTMVISPVIKANDTYITFNEHQSVLRSDITNMYSINPLRIIHMTTISDLTPEILSFVKKTMYIRKWRHSNGILELMIYTHSLSDAIRYNNFQLNAELSKYEGQINYHILYKSKWYLPYKTYRSGIYENHN